MQSQPADSITDVAPTLPQFTKTNGPLVTLGVEASPCDFFSLFFDESVLDLLVEETNRLVDNDKYHIHRLDSIMYSTDKITCLHAHTHTHHTHSYANERIETLVRLDQLPPRSRLRKWKDVSKLEMKGFLAAVMNMGIIKLPDLESYWKTSWISEIPFFRKLMPRNRFQEIFWMLHVSHPDPSLPAKKIDKVKQLLQLLVPKFREHYYPSKKLAIDETMIGFRGRFGAKQYTPKKTVKWGIKAFNVADSRNGYLLDTLVYTGADTLDEAQPEFESLPQPARVVMHLMRHYLDSNHHLYTDRYYTSIPLTQALSSRNTSFTGTVMRNRVDLPDTIRAKSFSLKQGEDVSFRCGQLMVKAWRAKGKHKDLVMLSSSSSAKMIVVPALHRTQRMLKPECVHDYNNSMNGVDRSDQYSVSYPFVRKTRKWWRKLFFYLLEVSVVNSYIIYREVTQKKITHLQFRRSIVESLAVEYLQQQESRRISVGRPLSQPLPIRLDKKLHLLEQRESRKECVVCSDRRSGSRHTTTFFCKTCPDQPTLHPTVCFERFHTLDRYKL